MIGNTRASSRQSLGSVGIGRPSPAPEVGDEGSRGQSRATEWEELARRQFVGTEPFMAASVTNVVNRPSAMPNHDAGGFALDVTLWAGRIVVVGVKKDSLHDRQECRKGHEQAMNLPLSGKIFCESRQSGGADRMGPLDRARRRRSFGVRVCSPSCDGAPMAYGV